jgi:lysozyme family protein
MADFMEAFETTLAHEGGYVKDPDDRGGETYKGIARRYNPGWPGWARIDNAKKQRGFPQTLQADQTLQSGVASFYRSHYWDKFQGDSISVQTIANELFDTAVNLGVARAIEFFQRALNVLNRNGALYDDLVTDGVFGPKSLAALRAYLKKDKPDYLLKILNVLQGMHYIEFMTRSPRQEKFARGWLNRVTIEKT